MVKCWAQDANLGNPALVLTLPDITKILAIVIPCASSTFFFCCFEPTNKSKNTTITCFSDGVTRQQQHRKHNKHYSDPGSLRKPCNHIADATENKTMALRASRRPSCLRSSHSHHCRALLSAHTISTWGHSVLQGMLGLLPVLGNTLSLCPPGARTTPPPSSPDVTTNNVSRQFQLSPERQNHPYLRTIAL